MNAWLQAQDSEFIIMLVVVPAALILVMVLAGIFTDILKR